LFDRRLRFYATTALLAYGIAWASGIYLALIGFRGNPAECSSSCLLGIVPGGLGWLLFLAFGHHAVLRFFTGTRALNEKRVQSLETGDGPEERRILEIVRETLSKRRVAKRLRNVETLAWSNIQAWESPRFKLRGYRKPSTLVVSAGLRGRLDIDEWSTYLRWHYLQRGWLRPRQTWYVAQPVIRALLPLFLVILIGAALSFGVGTFAFSLFASIVGPAVLLLVAYRSAAAMKKLLLRLDTVSTESLGSMSLLSLFKKIDSLGIVANEAAKRRTGWTARLWPEPTIEERISNLANRGSSSGTDLGTV
jgi:hypothetical protein